jgi:hypothetical protein
MLVQMIHLGGLAGPSGSQGTAGVIGPSPAASASTTASPVPPHPVPPPSHQGGSGIAPTTHPNVGGSYHSGGDSDMRRQWVPKMEFPQFDGSDVRIWLDKYSAYF